MGRFLGQNSPKRRGDAASSQSKRKQKTALLLRPIPKGWDRLLLQRASRYSKNVIMRLPAIPESFGSHIVMKPSQVWLLYRALACVKARLLRGRLEGGFGGLGKTSLV